ncbi:PREDICTED: glutamate-rich protein 6B [Calidris pugnax]|uniref:glutamate-rich protein 6B n=1 Tax=Calidris pugnax TaxID=198806 RepID=UPI00071D7C38|nr:PREDICTED: glutamate-rich protein 6B [Calidris pugnax]
MSNGQKLSGSGSNQSQPKIFPPETGSSDSSSALTVENVKRLENEYTTSKEAFTKQRIQDYIKQTNLACFNKETTREASTEPVQDAEPGPSSSFPVKQSKNSKEVCWKTSEEISRKDKMLTVVEVLSRHSEVYSEVGESKGATENEEEAAAQDGEENTQAGLCEQAGKEVQSERLLVCIHQMAVTKVWVPPGPTEVTSLSSTELTGNSSLEKDAWEPVELAQGSPRPELDKELLSTGGEHKDDETETSLCSGKETTWTEEAVMCTFCSTPEKPVPTVMDLKEQPQENLFCCRTYKEMFDDIIQDLMSEDEAEEEELDITSYADPSQADLKNSIKEKLLQQLDEGAFESYREILQQYMKFVALTRISFRLSKQNEYAVRPKIDPFQKYQPTSAPTEDLLELDSEFVAVHLKHCRSPEPVRRHYPDGQTFFLLFPDGSGQVYYPSGNVAILITFSEEALFTYCILEDSRYPGIRAAFGSHGHGVCFHPDGHLCVVFVPRASLNPCTGIYLDQERASQKCWTWHDFSHHTHSPPFQSITMKLNGYITIKILAQDQIDLSFTSHSDCIRFNMGSRLKLKDPEASHLLQWPESEEELFLQSKTIQLRSLLSKIQRALKCFWQPLSQ